MHPLQALEVPIAGLAAEHVDETLVEAMETAIQATTGYASGIPARDLKSLFGPSGGALLERPTRCRLVEVEVLADEALCER